jgi:hypothetical protein
MVKLDITNKISESITKLKTENIINNKTQINADAGFDSKALEASGYVGRGKFRVSETLASGKVEKASREAEKRQSIAERKAQAAIAAAKKTGDN